MTAREVCLIIIVALIAPSCGRNEGPRLPAIGKAFVGAKTLKIRREIGFHSDTIAEARFGIPDDVAREAITRLPPEMRVLVRALYARSTPSREIPGLDG